MAASSSKSEIQTHLDKKLITFDEKTCRNVDKFPVNFSGVPEIGEKIFGFLDFYRLKQLSHRLQGLAKFPTRKKNIVGSNFGKRESQT